MLKIGLVGVGGISASHISAWNAMPDAELAAICDIRRERLDLYPEQRRYLDFDEMLRSEKLDILDICLPTYLHVDYAVKAMERGIHVICEKPISLKAEEIERAYLAAEKNRVSFMIAQVLRFVPAYEYLKEFYDTGKYGKLLSGYMQRIGQRPVWSWDNWMMDRERSGLTPFDLHIHDLDFMVYAFGAPEKTTRRRSQLPNQDYFSAIYDYPGFFVTTECAWYDAPYPFTQGFRFQFEEALYVYENNTYKVYQNDGQIIDLTVAQTGDTGSIGLAKSDGYANEIRYFADCVLSGAFPDRVKPEELTAVLNLLNEL